MADQLLPRFVAVDLDMALFDTGPHEGAAAVVCPRRNVVEVAVEVDGVVPAHEVFFHSVPGMGRCPDIRGQERLFVLEGLCRYPFRRAVGQTVCRPGKPADGGLVQHLHVGELPAAQKVIFDVLDNILHFAFRLRVAFPAEHALEVLGGHERLKYRS